MSCSADDFYYELNSEKKIESRIFHKDNAYSDQKNTYATHLKSELFIEFKRNLNFLIEPYFRYDHYDKERTLLNISQGYLLYFNDYGETKIGKDKVFWGVTELKNLVDIINSPDNASGEKKSKLGQSLISYSYINDKIGFIDFLYMPEFNKPNHIGKRGRLRLNLPTENYNFTYEGNAGERVPSWAAKWQNSYAGLDVSFQFFRGTSREATTIPLLEAEKLKYFSSFERITQLGSFLQKIYGPIIFKFEGIRRNGQKNSKYVRENYYSYIGGIEYVITRIFDKAWDLNLFFEYSNDERGNTSVDIFQNDLFIGSSMNLNDIEGTEINQSFTLDLDGKGNTGSFEISTRLNDTIRIALDYNYYWSLGSTDTLYSFRRDNYLGFNITRYF